MSAVALPPTPSYGRYRVVEPLGSGSMGTVLLARDELLGRDVALKVVRAPVLMGAAAELFRQRFVNEARAVAAITHPNVVHIFDMGFEGTTPYLVMEYVRGAALQPRHAAGAAGLDALVRIAKDIASGLAAAHAAGLLHRDIKPGNILVSDDGEAKLADFGVARIPDSNITLMGQFLGTPSYGAPEALAEGTFTAAADVFSLGVTLFETLTGARPFGEKSTGLVLLKEKLPSLRAQRPDVPHALADLIAQMMAVDPAARPSLDAITTALERPLVATAPTAANTKQKATNEGKGPNDSRAAKPRRWWLGAVLAPLLGLAVHVVVSRYDPPRTPAERWRLAEEHVKRGDLPAAREELRRLLAAEPKNTRAREWLGRLDRVIGDRP